MFKRKALDIIVLLNNLAFLEANEEKIDEKIAEETVKEEKL
jgi:hypothetical protein